MKRKKNLLIESAIKEKLGTSKNYCAHFNADPTNHKRRLYEYINKLEKWLGPLDLEICIKKRSKNEL